MSLRGKVSRRKKLEKSFLLSFSFLIQLISFDGDCTPFQRELQEKELDIIHLNKEIQELQLENKLLKAKVPITYQNGHTSVRFNLDISHKIRELLYLFYVEQY